MRKHSEFTVSIVARALCVALSMLITVPNVSSQASGAESSKILPKPGERVSLDPNHYFVYGFDKAPKLGTAIMKVEVFAQDGSHDTTFVVKGDVDMPSMRGAHSTGDKQFSVSKKGVYLLPVPIAMPGEWEFKFTFEKDGKAVFHGAYRFEV
jgi:hypothetical protein